MGGPRSGRVAKAEERGADPGTVSTAAAPAGAGGTRASNAGDGRHDEGTTDLNFPGIERNFV